MKISFSNDHAAVASRHLIDELKAAGHEVIDYGVQTEQRIDYPDVAAPALKDLVSGNVDRTILVCGSGIGMSIVANRLPGVRCVLATDNYSAEMSRKHNDSNCLALRSREQAEEVNSELLKTWLDTDFENERHVKRNAKIESVGSICGFRRETKGENQ